MKISFCSLLVCLARGKSSHHRIPNGLRFYVLVRTPPLIHESNRDREDCQFVEHLGCVESQGLSLPSRTQQQEERSTREVWEGAELKRCTSFLENGLAAYRQETSATIQPSSAAKTVYLSGDLSKNQD